ncbi:MAG TPA: putative glycolipid-binding domain-containing protein [Ktedonobacterales bacterium]|jgi:hypothetical protein|nr:putative glycolipid-binding domain-containing protein [Ktedonobacterales bacterium]
MTDSLILWKWLDRPGHDTARLSLQGATWHITGAAILAHEGRPCLLKYAITCDEAWHTQSGRVEGWVGETGIATSIERDATGHWLLDGKDCPQVAGCTDIDLNFSPVTNVIPIRRLRLAVGQEAPVRAAWLRFPSFTLEPLEQVYHRLSENVYRYESAGGAFVANITVNANGLATHYPPAWEAVAASE